MTTTTTPCPCLVARAAAVAEPKADVEEGAADISLANLDHALKGLRLSQEPKPREPAQTKSGSRIDMGMSPADFIALQSMRSSALAKKTNTTAKFTRDQRNLFTDLLLDTSSSASQKKKSTDEGKPGEKPEKKKEEEDEKKASEKAPSEDDEAKKEKQKDDTKTVDGGGKEGPTDKEADNADDQLISRGPVRANRAPLAVYHPYEQVPLASYGTAALSKVYDPSSYTQHFNDYGYECGAPDSYDWAENGGWRRLPSNSSTPDTVANFSEIGSRVGSEILQSSEWGSGNRTCAGATLPASVPIHPNAQGAAAGSDELPEALSDFILQYSRRYTSPSPTPTATLVNGVSATAAERKLARRGSSSGDSDSSSQRGSPDAPGPLHKSPGEFNSPVNAGSAPTTSPAAPLSSDAQQQLNQQLANNAYCQGACGGSPPLRRAKERLRAMISDGDMDNAVLWTCKCMQHYPGALRFQDQDQDSLLHIVMAHMDLAKICALVEQMIKMDVAVGDEKPFDMCNALGETPLFLAVERGHVLVVDYLLEVGASPNVKSIRFGQNTPLHYGAGHGLEEIVETLCSYSATSIDPVNGKGQTPLMNAVLNNGLFDEGKGKLLDNSLVVKLLLRYGADPLVVNASDCGKNVLHYAVDRMDLQMVELLKEDLIPQNWTALVNHKDIDSKTPGDYLAAIPVRSNEDESRVKISELLAN